MTAMVIPHNPDRSDDQRLDRKREKKGRRRVANRTWNQVKQDFSVRQRPKRELSAKRLYPDFKQPSGAPVTINDFQELALVHMLVCGPARTREIAAMCRPWSQGETDTRERDSRRYLRFLAAQNLVVTARGRGHGCPLRWYLTGVGEELALHILREKPDIPVCCTEGFHPYCPEEAREILRRQRQ